MTSLRAGLGPVALCLWRSLSEGISHYSISDQVVNSLLLELIQLAREDQSVFDVVNHPPQSDLEFSSWLDAIEEELSTEKVFT